MERPFASSKRPFLSVRRNSPTRFGMRSQWKNSVIVIMCGGPMPGGANGDQVPVAATAVNATELGWDIEAQIREIQARKANVGKQGNFDNGEGVPLTASANGAYMDEDIYGHTQSKYDGYVTSIAANDDADADDDDYESTGLMQTKKMPLPSAFLAELTDKDYDPFADRRVPRIADREDQYRAQRRKLMISPERVDPFADGGKTPDMKSRTYTVIMQEQALTKDQSSQTPSHARWDETPGRAKGSETPGATPGYSSTRMWDPTPAHATPGHATPGHETPGGTQKGAAPGTPSARRNRWDETPKTERGNQGSHYDATLKHEPG
ncbi:hypothetical protein HPB51_022186 [Rhipicephalus microplus]|uniref:Uncharacterized protein n=1 Tax=Rhipicephalus microplus TaxID=6941 RepID=A0A9J6F6C7_RHIMP|nr:hypothetical protein HPB51_022186 [Rhipicephalus microplus]